MGKGQTDEELVRCCQRGDRTAFDELVERYHGAIYGFVLRRSLFPW